MQFWIIDTFSSSLFGGNTAVVCLLKENLRPQILQKIAKEFHVNETVFISFSALPHFQIQWFTPFSNESICGHGLLAAAHVLWNELAIDGIGETIYFDTPLGVLPITRSEGKISIKTKRMLDSPVAAPERLISALGIPPISVSKCDQIYIVELFSVKQVMKLEPDIAKFEKIPCSGIVITAEYGNDVSYDFASRFFAPNYGIKEDYATVWNHCFLGPYWEQRLNRSQFTAIQSAEQKSIISVKCEGECVDISGNCIVSASGTLRNTNDWSFNNDLFNENEEDL
ncbi:MAG: PhzF family phenazine biosynthesis protein [Holosporales bacterium]|jgi:PhzF family phenazine biosynthesis protein|nr:PhzF family phenazine biosynthesis protein [Holosporales bacterium]